MGAEEKGAGAMTAKAEALSPRRLMLLTGLLVSAIAVLFFGKIQEEEKNIRRNPLTRTSDLLKKVFSKQDSNRK
ncbi:MAG TPA: DUF4197 family protein [Parvularculaceae bacterium]|nr:DUF4197 family protein [Parvularculaceae bacterium]